MKKITDLVGNINIPGMEKSFRIMKLTSFFLLISVVSVLAGKTYSQTKLLTLNFENTSVKEILSKIEDQSEFYFMYSEKIVDVNREVSVNIENQKIETILNTLFTGTDVDYTVKDRIIVLTTPEVFDNTAQVAFQQKSVSGKVTDNFNQPLPGVTVVVKGTTIGTVTNADGNYTLANVPDEAVLQFSFVGIRTQEIAVGSQTNINVRMEEETIGLEEVVAVGYGTQRRENITGSVATATNENIEGEPVVQVSHALQGDVSGVTIRQLGGQPGAETSEIRIRGYGTFSSAGNNPLVIIDGIPGSIDDVNPNDIKNISVLKDAASAAIYGSRAANGVILIQTKRGQAGLMQVTYNGYVGFSELADMPKFVDSWDYAMAYNEALENMGLGKRYTDEEIQKFISGESPDTHPNDHHYKMAFENRALQTKHDIAISGGNSMTKFHFSLGYLRNDGLLQNNIHSSYKDNLINYYNQYNVRLNIDSEINEKLDLTVNMSGKAGDDHAPGEFTGDGTMERLVTRLLRMSAAIPARTSEGWYGRIDKGSPWGSIDSENHELNKDYHFLGNADLTYNIFGPFKLTGRAGYVFNHSNYRRYIAEMRVQPSLLQTPSKLNVEWDTRRELTLEALATYDQTFDDHELHLLAGYSQIENKFNSIEAYRDRFPTNELYELNVASSENQQNNGGATEWGLVSYFGRMQYSFMGKYLLEANARYDGSSRFGPGNKFGLFPSFSFGWRVSEEEFVQENLPWIHNLKFRGSWGELGNQQISPYPYQGLLATGANAIFGNSVFPGVTLNTVANKDITWETTRVVDLGVDFSVFSGKLNFAVDYFDKTTRDILYGITTAGVLGLNSSPVNAGKVRNRGWDVDVTYQNSIGEFSYSISPNFTIIDNEVLSLAHVEKDIQQGLFVGGPLNAIYGYYDDGLFVDEQDIQNYPAQPYNPVPGDIKYKDISGPDGVPDGKVTAEFDRAVIGQSSPKYSYGGQFTAKYKAFDFSCTVYGEGGMLRQLEGYAERAFGNASNVQQWMWDNRWTAENPNPDAIYPRFFIGGSGRNEPYSWLSTYWARNASYFKIKSVQLGLNIKNMRFYVSGRNLLTFDNYYPGWDPEILVSSSGAGAHYPMTRTYIFGFNVKF